jgi:hypothetical protein
MLKRVYWYVTDRVMVVEYADYITLADVAEADGLILAMVQHLPAPRQVHYVLDVRQRGEIDPAAQRWRNIRAYVRPFDGWLVVIDPQPHALMRFLMATVCQVLRIRFRVFGTFEDGLIFLARVDPELGNWF